MTKMKTPKRKAVCFADWKGRPEWSKTQQPMCRIRLHANAKNLQHCPVHWLFKHWSLRKENGDPSASGPIIDHVSSANNKRRRNNGRDPVWDFWMFDADSQHDTMDKGSS
jgi:hypothetical protein